MLPGASLRRRARTNPTAASSGAPLQLVIMQAERLATSVSMAVVPFSQVQRWAMGQSEPTDQTLCRVTDVLRHYQPRLEYAKAAAG
jgi:hypothetical protein